MNEFLTRLQPYPFEKLATIRAQARPPAHLRALDLTIGEPKHPTPALILETLAANLSGTGSYPLVAGTPALRAAIAGWLVRRYGLAPESIDPERMVLPVNGTREALFAIAHCVIDRRRERPVVVMPNPFYQIYEGAALLAGAEPYFVNCTEATGFVPDYDSVPEDVWRRCQLLYTCSPGNPAGTVLGKAVLEKLLAMADRHDFVIAADECYSEIYPDERAPPPGLLQIAAACGNTGYRHCLVFHSLSKRSSAPGMRSGFVAGEATLVREFARYRTYHGCAMAPYAQAASIAAWNDEEHVRASRALYREKFERVVPILGQYLPVQMPEGGFYLWPRLPVDGTEFCRGLLDAENVCVLPGAFLAREAHGANPGTDRVRIALVASVDDCVEAAHRIARYSASFKA
ncbi:MAG: succinyldiaminopimelate transaminase [Gammaproteobacteria bacterium]